MKMQSESLRKLLYTIGGTIALLSTVMLGWHAIYLLVSHQRVHISLILMVSLLILSILLRLPYSWDKILIRVRGLLELGLSVCILVLMLVSLSN